jgi:hypothetical protein
MASSGTSTSATLNAKPANYESNVFKQSISISSWSSNVTSNETTSAKRLQFRSPTSARFGNAHNRKILVACGLVVIPMVLFTVAILWIVFKNIVGNADCPFPELCPVGLVNVTTRSHYYVDYPAARLAFISSWSSSVSFALISAIMTLYGYLVAKSFLSVSGSSAGSAKLPSTYQFSILIRVLNADILTLRELCWRRLKTVFWHKQQSTDRRNQQRRGSMVHGSVTMLLICIFCRYVTVPITDMTVIWLTYITVVVQSPGPSSRYLLSYHH